MTGFAAVDLAAAIRRGRLSPVELLDHCLLPRQGGIWTGIKDNPRNWIARPAGIGNNLSGIFAGHVSGETGMTTQSALGGYTFGFWSLMGAGVLLFLIAPLINKLMHGVK